MKWLLLGMLFVLIGIASCSSDDTEIEATPEPKPVEQMEAEPDPIPLPEPDYEYFQVLESWGAEDGLINVAKDNAGNCVDSLVANKAPFPVPVSRNITTEWPYMEVECNPDLFVTPATFELELNRGRGTISRVVSYRFGTTWDGTRENGSPVVDRTSGIVFVKSKVAPNVIGGYIYAEFNEDRNEYRDRKRLNEHCGPKPLQGVIGDWQAIKTGRQFRFCVRLDSLPGSVKCVLTDHDGYGVFADTLNSIKLYRNGRFVDLDPALEGFTSRSPGALWLFGGQNHTDYQGADRLCYLFDEGDKGECREVCEYRETYIRCGLGDPDPDCQPSPDDPSGSTKLVEVEFCRCERE